jgi:hypothetical protein
VAMPVTKVFDKIIPSRRDVAMLHFKKKYMEVVPND